MHAAIVAKLTECGVNPDSCDRDGWTAMLRAVKNGYTAVVQILLDEGAEIESEAPDSLRTPLMLAVQTGNCELVRLLIHKGANVNHEDYEGFRALSLAVIRSDHPLSNCCWMPVPTPMILIWRVWEYPRRWRRRRISRIS
jgi:ankyrin repeat protein